jgi:gluconolactonase
MTHRVVCEGLGFTEGPISLPGGGVALASVTEGAVFIVDGSEPPRRIDTGGGPNGLAVDAGGTIYVAQNGGIWGGKEGTEPGIQRISPDGAVEALVSGVGAPNDICFGPDGRLYFTDSREETNPDDPSSGPPGRLYSCEDDGRDLRLVLEGPAFINGLAFDPQGEHLYVVETARKRVLRYDWREGELETEEEVCAIDSGYPDGLAIDSAGRIWLAATFQEILHIFSPAGETIGELEIGVGCSNCCFGGADRKLLYITAPPKGALLELDVDIPGEPLYPFR